jgi:hypothetical protein
MSDEIDILTKLITYVARSLGFEEVLDMAITSEFQEDFLGTADAREIRMLSILNDINDYATKNEPAKTLSLRLFVARYMPRFLLGYQSLRFPQILEKSAPILPNKVDLSRFPELVNETGLFVPVSAVLRLIAVCIVDDEAKEELIRAGNVKTIVSHMVDDPLNPYQRECAIFVVKVFTTGYEKGQIAISGFMAKGIGPR